MPTEHVDIIDGERHEPKGADSASASEYYVSDGAQSGAWRLEPHGALYYDDLGTGETITTPTVMTLIAPTTIGDSNPKEITHNTLGRLTYTGDTTMDFNAAAAITLKHSSASLVDVQFQLHVNGIAQEARHVTAALSGNYQHVTLSGHLELATGDYVEVFCLSASGNVIVHTMTLTLTGKI